MMEIFFGECRGLENIDCLRQYSYIRYLNLSKNKLRGLAALSFLQNLLTLDVTENRLVENGQLSEKQFLQVANFAHNRLTSLSLMNHPRLEQLNINCESC
jgi:hypothetical protein